MHQLHQYLWNIIWKRKQENNILVTECPQYKEALWVVPNYTNGLISEVICLFVCFSCTNYLDLDFSTLFSPQLKWWTITQRPAHALLPRQNVLISAEDTRYLSLFFLLCHESKSRDWTGSELLGQLLLPVMGVLFTRNMKGDQKGETEHGNESQVTWQAEFTNWALHKSSTCLFFSPRCYCESLLLPGEQRKAVFPLYDWSFIKASILPLSPQSLKYLLSAPLKSIFSLVLDET